MKLSKLNKTTRKNFLTYGLVIIAFVVLQAMILGGSITSSLKGMLVPICAYVVMAISRFMRQRDYHCLICSYGANHGMERDNLQFMLTCGIDGLFYSPEDLSAEEFKELTAHCGIPIVQFDRMIQGVNADAVLVDNSDIVYQAVSRLVEKGHKRIAIITGPKSVFSARERLVGYLRALSDHGILYDDSLVISDENTFATGYRGCESLLRLPEPPTAIFATNYDITIGLITAAREKGIRIPEQLDIVGFDCPEVCGMMNPPMPVVHQPEAEIGQKAAHYLIERLSGFDGESRTTRLACTLVPD